MDEVTRCIVCREALPRRRYVIDGEVCAAFSECPRHPDGWRHVELPSGKVRRVRVQRGYIYKGKKYGHARV
jgi:hypothetical protein